MTLRIQPIPREYFSDLAKGLKEIRCRHINCLVTIATLQATRRVGAGGAKVNLFVLVTPYKLGEKIEHYQ